MDLRQFSHTNNSIHWRPDIMRHAGQEITFSSISLFCFRYSCIKQFPVLTVCGNTVTAKIYLSIPCKFTGKAVISATYSYQSHH